MVYFPDVTADMVAKAAVSISIHLKYITCFYSCIHSFSMRKFDACPVAPDDKCWGVKHFSSADRGNIAIYVVIFVNKSPCKIPILQPRAACSMNQNSSSQSAE